jgi:hypothetical protein
VRKLKDDDGLDASSGANGGDGGGEVASKYGDGGSGGDEMGEAEMKAAAAVREAAKRNAEMMAAGAAREDAIKAAVLGHMILPRKATKAASSALPSPSASTSSGAQGDDGPRITLLVNYWSYRMDGDNLITHGVGAGESGRLHPDMEWKGRYDELSKKAHRRCSPPKLPLDYFLQLEREEGETAGGGNETETGAGTKKTGDGAVPRRAGAGDAQGDRRRHLSDATVDEAAAASAAAEAAAAAKRRVTVDELWPAHPPHDHHDPAEATAAVQALLRSEKSGAISACNYVHSGEASNKVSSERRAMPGAGDTAEEAGAAAGAGGAADPSSPSSSQLLQPPQVPQVPQPPHLPSAAACRQARELDRLAGGNTFGLLASC